MRKDLSQGKTKRKERKNKKLERTNGALLRPSQLALCHPDKILQRLTLKFVVENWFINERM